MEPSERRNAQNIFVYVCVIQPKKYHFIDECEWRKRENEKRMNKCGEMRNWNKLTLAKKTKTPESCVSLCTCFVFGAAYDSFSFPMNTTNLFLYEPERFGKEHTYTVSVKYRLITIFDSQTAIFLCCQCVAVSRIEKQRPTWGVRGRLMSLRRAKRQTSSILKGRGGKNKHTKIKCRKMKKKWRREKKHVRKIKEDSEKGTMANATESLESTNRDRNEWHTHIITCYGCRWWIRLSIKCRLFRLSLTSRARVYVKLLNSQQVRDESLCCLLGFIPILFVETVSCIRANFFGFRTSQQTRKNGMLNVSCALSILWST